jgi:hypothetical protein
MTSQSDRAAAVGGAGKPIRCQGGGWEGFLGEILGRRYIEEGRSPLFFVKNTLRGVAKPTHFVSSRLSIIKRRIKCRNGVTALLANKRRESGFMRLQAPVCARIDRLGYMV